MLIAFAGKAGVGKDTAGDLICREQCAVKVALADPMKRICRDIYGFTDEQLWGSSEHRAEPVESLGGLTARRALQQLGTEWGRALYPNTWVDILIRHAICIGGGTHRYSKQEGCLYKTDHQMWQYVHVVVTDVRFPNEVESINRAGGKVIRIVRGDLASEAAQHASETSLDDVPEDQFCATILNQGTEDAFLHMVRAAYQHATSGAEGRLWLNAGVRVAVAL
jgi:hypothetical protein